MQATLGQRMSIFKKKESLSTEQKGLRYIVGVITLIMLWKYRATIVTLLGIELPFFWLFDEEPPQRNIAGALLMIAEAIVYYLGAIVIVIATRLHSLIGYAGEGLWGYVQAKADDGDPEVETNTEKIVDVINRMGGYINDLLDRVEFLEQGDDWEEVDDE